MARPPFFITSIADLRQWNYFLPFNSIKYNRFSLRV